MQTALVIVAGLGAAALMLGAATVAPAAEGAARATVDKAATVRVDDANRDATRGGGRLIITVEGFEPSPNGPVEAVVSVDCRDGPKEIGRFGVFPNSSFAASGRVKPLRYGFALPEDLTCRPVTVSVRLVPDLGDGAGASVAISNARID